MQSWSRVWNGRYFHICEMTLDSMKLWCRHLRPRPPAGSSLGGSLLLSPGFGGTGDFLFRNPTALVSLPGSRSQMFTHPWRHPHAHTHSWYRERTSCVSKLSIIPSGDRLICKSPVVEASPGLLSPSLRPPLPVVPPLPSRLGEGKNKRGKRQGEREKCYAERVIMAAFVLHSLFLLWLQSGTARVTLILPAEAQAEIVLWWVMVGLTLLRVGQHHPKKRREGGDIIKMQ